MKKVILSLLIVPVLVISCQKDDAPPPVTPPAAVKYMSLTAGSTWNYELVDNTVAATVTTPFTLTSSSRDSTINGKSYHVFTNSSGSSNEYYFIDGSNYYNFRSLPVILGNSSVEYLYLKDNVAVGASGSWSQSFPVTFSGVTLDATLTNTISEKGISKMVKGTTYANVFHVTTTISVAGVPASALQSDIQAYYAEKYGMIESVNKINLDFFGIKDSTNQQTSLISADIK